MIFHDCVKCGYSAITPIAEHTPCLEKWVCPQCGEEQWLYHSKINPMTYSKDSVIVDEKTKTVEIKGEDKCK